MFFSRQPQQLSLRDKQIQNLKQEAQVTTKVEGQSYIVHFTTKFGKQFFLVELPPQFPTVRPVLRFEKKVTHSNVDNRGHIVNFPNLNNWRPQSDLRTVVRTVINRFLALPPEPVLVPVNPGQQGRQPAQPQFGNHGRPNQPLNKPPPSYNQFQQPQNRPLPSYNQFQQHPGGPGYQPQQYPGPGQQSPVAKPVAAEKEPTPEPVVEKIEFDVPNNFEILETLEPEDMDALLQNETTLKDLALDCSVYQSAKTLQEDSRSALRQEIEKNLAREPEVNAQRSKLENTRKEVESLVNQYQDLKQRQDQVLQRYSKDSIAQQLEESVNLLDEECNSLKEQFENDEIKLVKYVNLLVKKRQLYHLRQIKKTRLENLVM